MARKKSDVDTADKKKIPAINFKCSTELKRDLEDLAHLSRRDVSSLLVEVATELVKANKARITKFRQQAGQPIKIPTCATSPSKTAAQVDLTDRQIGAYNAPPSTPMKTFEVNIEKNTPPNLAKTQYLIDVKPASVEGSGAS